MATISSTSLTVNNSSTTSITIGETGGNATVDLSGVTLFISNTDKKALCLNKLVISVTELSGIVSTKTVYMARDPHKMMMCKTTINGSLSSFDANTSISDMLTTTNGVIDLSCFMPYQNTGSGTYGTANLDATGMGKICKIHGEVKVGLKLDYTNPSNVAQTKYCPLSTSALEWKKSSSTANRIVSANGISGGGDVVSFSADPDSDYYFEALDFLNCCKANRVLTKFGLGLADIKASTTVTLTPFLYMGGLFLLGTNAPTGLAYITNSSGGILSFSSTRISGIAGSTIAVTSADTTNNNGLSTSDEYGWVSNYNTSPTSTDDTSIIVTVTIT